MKRKFVKVMFFGALALSTVTYVGCKDYDDDIKSVQEQIDQIKSNNPVSVGDMQTAINVAKSALESQLADLKTKLENKDSQIKDLGLKITDLEDKLSKTADKATVDQLTKDLATAKNDLEALKKLQKSDIDGLTARIVKLEALKEELDGLKVNFATKEELKNYVESAKLSGLISDEIATALGEDGEIAAAINDAIQTKVLADFGSMKEVAALAGEDATVADVIKELYAAINADKTGILAKLTALEDYQTALEDKAVENGFESVEAVIAEVKSLKTTLSGLYASAEFSEKVKAIVSAELTTVNSRIDTLEDDLAKLGVAIKGMIQSVVYIPTSIDRSVDFYTLYAKKTSTSSSYVVAAKSADAKELQFRISPASAAMTLEDFNKNYEIKLNAEERNWTRAAEPFAVEVKNCEAGVLTVSLTTSSEKSHAISLNIVSTKDAEGKEGLTPTNVNSDYIAVIQSSYYLKTAYYEVATEKAGEIIYDAPQPVDYSGVGTLTVSYTTTASGSTAFTKTLEELNGVEIYEEFLGETDPFNSDKSHPKNHVAYGYGACVATIGEDNKVANLHVAYDVGRVVNPQSCTGQAEGGAIMGMGYAVTEDFPYKEGYVTSKYGTLGLLRATQCPPIHVSLIEKGTPEQYAYGAKGIGEISSIPIAPAIANAYRRIDGEPRRSLPIKHTGYKK